MATKHLRKQYDEEQVKEPYHTAVNAALSNAKRNVIQNVMVEQAKIKETPKDVNVVIEKANENRVTGDVEENIRQHQIKEAQKIKKQLNDKLHGIDVVMHSLEVTEKPTVVRVKIQDSETRRELAEAEKKRQTEAAEFARKMAEQRRDAKQKAREQRQTIHERKARILDRDHERQEHKQKMIEIEKQERLERLQERSKMRKGKLDEQLAHARNSSYQPRPQYKSLEDRYQEKVLLPELERRKEELAKKRLIFKPLNHEEMEEHAKRYEQVQREFEERRDKNRKNMKTGHSLSNMLIAKHSHPKIYQDPERQHKAIVEEERKDLKKKANRYSAIVKDVYKPKVDPAKVLELKIVNEKRETKMKPKGYSPSPSQTMEPSESPIPTKPRKIRSASGNSKTTNNPQKRIPNRFESVNQSVRKSKASDYLAENRRAREESDKVNPPRKIEVNWENALQQELDFNTRMRKIQEKSIKVEKQARRQELMLKNMNPTDSVGVEMEEDLNDAIIGSIKAKLQLLDA